MRTVVADGVLKVTNPNRWLATGPGGGFRTAPAAYNVSVPEGFDRTDLDTYVAERRERAGFEADGPALLTGVDLVHARGAREGSVTVVATAGLSNPATLPMDPDAGVTTVNEESPDREIGTVNLLVGTTRALDRGALATLLASAVEAKTATLQSLTGFTGTTSDAVVVGCDTDGESAEFAGSGTSVGAATRACVREAVRASLRSRYADREIPDSVTEADHGVRTDERALVFELTDRE
ncbi:adenosylcobinamide amidohydrolase [Halorientalis sp. IM1011]|uniref:adenosylcobinamide amidohydrolase n=1 Tax=Halorientalis sp. IM1011 TaxID=1932360 RepID=UPI00097CC32B|nr:adenosylcobinamide amidohydrolase [Halorientalis sp. IM1011]AQL42061.1 adenosylcobinamide amidohydrolase [Halorientalis sp. IM1011]